MSNISINRPKLLLFQNKYHQNISDFVKLHKQDHVKCFANFFEVIVINYDCDYQEVCEKYQPELTLFESGNEYSDCSRLSISNINTHYNTPKLGFFNSDSFSSSRQGFLSDMELWGIDVFFSLSVNIANYMSPQLADNLFVWPNSIDPEIYRDYQQPKIIPVLFTGYISTLYPWRQEIYQILSQYYPTLTCPHGGYSISSKVQMLKGEQYAKTINASWFVPTCGNVSQEIVRKHFEIPGSKACLVTEESSLLKSAGFVDMKNCIFADQDNILDKLNYLFKNLDILDNIIKNGYDLVHAKHTLKQRDQIFQWFNLKKNLGSHQKIVQLNPFEEVKIVEQSTKNNNSYFSDNTLISKLLKQGDQKLYSKQYEEAETYYIKCLNYIHWMPEPKLKLALCNLYKGDAPTAYSWIIQSIEYTLGGYGAVTPDPLEWSYLIITLLCLGQFARAVACAKRFSHLNYPELNYIYRILNISTETIDSYQQQRYSIHFLPKTGFDDWFNNVQLMLKACKQNTIIDKLNVIKKNDLTVNNCTPMSVSEKFLTHTLIIDYKVIQILKRIIKKTINYLETKLGHYLPDRISELKNDIFLYNIKLLLRREGLLRTINYLINTKKDQFILVLEQLVTNQNIKTITIIGDSVDQYLNKALLLGPIIQNDMIEINNLTIEKNLLLVGDLNTNFLTNNYLNFKFILLINVNSLSGYKVFHDLISSKKYLLSKFNINNGYAIFTRIN